MFSDKKRKSSTSTVAALHLFDEDGSRSKTIDSEDDHVSLVETESMGSIPNTLVEGDHEQEDDEVVYHCDACSHCSDVCNNPNCTGCCMKRQKLHSHKGGASSSLSPCRSSFPCQPTTSPHTTKEYSMCEIRRHNHEGSAWLRMGDHIYDATSILAVHPAGASCILRRAGGIVDCTADFQFHSKRGQIMFKKHYIGRIRPCSGYCCSTSTTTTDRTMKNKKNDTSKDWWVFW
jgi:cytochrome b involved in lipid metabolism